MKQVLKTSVVLLMTTNIFNDAGLKFIDDTMLLDHHANIIDEVTGLKYGESYRFETSLKNNVTLKQDEDNPGTWIISIETNFKIEEDFYND